MVIDCLIISQNMLSCLPQKRKDIISKQILTNFTCFHSRFNETSEASEKMCFHLKKPLKWKSEVCPKLVKNDREANEKWRCINCKKHAREKCSGVRWNCFARWCSRKALSQLLAQAKTLRTHLFYRSFYFIWLVGYRDWTEFGEFG